MPRGRGWLCLAWHGGLGAPGPRCTPALAGEGGCRGAALPGSQLTVSPRVLAGCWWFRSQLGAVEGHITKGSHKSVLREGTRLWWESSGCPEAAAASLTGGSRVFRVLQGPGLPGMQEITWAGIGITPGSSTLAPELKGEFPVAERSVLHRFPSRAYLCSPP